MNRLFCFTGLLLSMFLYAQESNMGVYQRLKSSYSHFEKNDEKAFYYLTKFISKARKDSNFTRLVEAYRDAVFFSSTDKSKLKYADSSIWAAKRSKNRDLISMAYLGKGIVYYSTMRKYPLALKQYLIAYQYAEKTKDLYLKHKIIYHIGVIKSYLGYYEQASEHFIKSSVYFQQYISGDYHYNELFNHNKGYFNSQHQLAVCYRNMNNYLKADSIVSIGLENTTGRDDFALEKSYFLSDRAVSDYNKRNYSSSIANLKEAVSKILKSGDYASTSLIYYYLGKNYQAIGKKSLAMEHFKKVDSVFAKRTFLHPETLSSYKELIRFYKEKDQHTLQLYYTNQLLKADSLISKDFTFLSLRLHRDYDTKVLREQIEELKEYNTSRIRGSFFVIVLILMAIFILSKYSGREGFIVRRGTREIETLSIKDSEHYIRKNGLSPEIENELLEKLRIFEESKEFTKRGLSLNKLALKLKTNSYYLSMVINDFKGCNFSYYLSTLRIEYITNLLNTDRKFLSYTIEALANECGMASRQNFSDLFFEINGVRPRDFINKIKRETGLM
ncbi:AraC family transcriptional regulator [Elizabethkingia sp. HX XZB]|uniref:helix-turn-helix domain-containing protein n=1 Tax=Elizabethkingia sp. HX XZB TaxID=3003193 RepID=UPI002A240D04|nr:AraC family transcriptional regulator [Elizabethkingia sp. HX XZB]MDX8568165.1 AraC family transcriptional regulator [Elizabethkingia sp. HX XZB]